MKNFRENFVLFLIFSIFLVFILRLYLLQIKKGDYYRALAEGIFTYIDMSEKERGKIYAETGEVLATNKEVFSLVLIPELFEDKKLKNLAEILKIPEEEILKAKGSNSKIIRENLTQDEIQKINEARIKGVYFLREIKRIYPQGEIASRLLGFVNKEGKGQYGLEEFYDEELKEGKDLVLNLNLAVQLEAERLLKKAKEEFDMEEGEIIVLDPMNGKILALANFPTFNPNEFFLQRDVSLFQNLSSQKLFEPGSVFKPITMSIGLEEGKITPQETYEDKGFVQIGGWKILNYDERKYGLQTMTNVLEKSINTGAVYVQRKIGKEKFLEYLEKFKFFEKSNIDLNETFSENRELRKGREINLATASFGQGIEINSFQLARAFSALVNGGNLLKLSIVKKIVSDGNEIEIQTPTPQRVISKETSQRIVEMLISVVENGFGKRAKIEGYFIGGKTGTAQVPLSALGISQKGYSNQTIQTFVGFFPAFNPQFLVLVKLKNPKTKTAEYSAVPVFHEMAKFLINHYQIPAERTY